MQRRVPKLIPLRQHFGEQTFALQNHLHQLSPLLHSGEQQKCEAALQCASTYVVECEIQVGLAQLEVALANSPVVVDLQHHDCVLHHLLRLPLALEVPSQACDWI